MRHLLVVHHSRSGGTEAMARSVLSGASHPDIVGVDVRSRLAPDAGHDDVQWAEAVIIGTPENFGSVSGLVKDFLERIYHPCLEQTRGMPYGMFVRAGNDGRGAVSAVQRILTGLAWREARPPVIARGDELTDTDLDACWELGATMAASLSVGLSG
jgi:multimeric flavodoxin WrbA